VHLTDVMRRRRLAACNQHRRLVSDWLSCQPYREARLTGRDLPPAQKGSASGADAFGRKHFLGQISPSALAQLAKDERWKVREKAAMFAEEDAAGFRGFAGRLARREQSRRHSCERARPSRKRSGSIPPNAARSLRLLGEALDPALEHAAMFSAIATRAFDLDTLRAVSAPRVIRRRLVVSRSIDKGRSVQKDAFVGNGQPAH
jgi:hypothetical protein